MPELAEAFNTTPGRMRPPGGPSGANGRVPAPVR
jgi:hypothetical protein